MAPKLQPKTLYQLSLLATAGLVDEGCSSALLNFGGYGSPECAVAIETMQQQLLSHLPLSTLEDVAEERNNSRLCGRRGGRGVMWNRDARIKLSVFLHPSVTRFSVDTKGNELMQVSMTSSEQDGSDGLDEMFWCSQMGRMNNLVSLSLNLIATDEILVVVGRSCPKLEVVNIVSRIKQATHPHFSAITLKFCVSDIGLRALLQCQRLQSITMNKIINHQSSYQSISLQGIRELVRGLPLLSYINFCSMGKVIAGEEFNNLLPEVKGDKPPSPKSSKLTESSPALLSSSPQPLHLRHFTELDPASIDVSRIQCLCPYVQHLSLTVPMSFDGSHSHVSASVDTCNEILQAVADSELSLVVLELQQFPYGAGFRNLMQKKGPGLQELIFRANGNLNSTHVSFIGTYCPNLQRLHLKELGRESTPSLVVSLETQQKWDCLFSGLTAVHLSGNMWSPNIILPLVLSSAKNIQHISLLNMNYRPTMDASFVSLLDRNLFKKLKSLCLYGGCFLSLTVLRRLVLSSACPNLSSLSFLQFQGIETADVEAMRSAAAADNLDIKICCLELGWTE